ncbi:hypothetical protein QMG83_00950 [Salinibacterium sp. G-O1]|uniref:hypothetical protein n=1 Tax=Salinibacterium sp. G-O1 TaxID=3046208 RepID=UPI0024BA08E3|nr:hypothetical protein [Salinibacterium sp. G-O1]MDJ0333783.1 hypothetical protein [Salinibacterium sp. G-O1]
MTRVRALGLYGLTVVLNGTVSLVSIPIVVAIVGADQWASMATGQSIGGALAVFVAFGWGLTGPATVARLAPHLRQQLFLDSLFARGLLVLPVVVVHAVATIAIVPHAKPVAFFAGLAMLLAGVSAGWFFAGESRPGRFLVLDTVPRVAGTILGLVLVILTQNLLLFALAQLLGSLVALAVSAWVILHGRGLDFRAAARFRVIAGNLLEQRHGVVATGIYSLFTPAVLGLVAVVSPTLLPQFVLADRLSKFVSMAASPLGQVFQGWVPAVTGRELARRLRVSGTITTSLALSAGVGFMVFLRPFSELMTHGQVNYTVAAAVAFGLVAMTQIAFPYLSNVGLMAVNRLSVIVTSVAVGVPVALVLLVVVEFVAPEHTVWALVAGNAIMVGWQLASLRAATRQLADAERPTAPSQTEPVPSGGR